MKETIKDFYGEGLESTSSLAHIVNKAAFQRLTSYLKDVTAEKIVHGGELNEEEL